MPEGEGPDPGRRPGRVYLVGAGPGDPGLLTARALELIAGADVILHDRLIPEQALAQARPEAELLFVGKEGGGAFVPQDQTESLMVDRARAGCSVVRLKGGDPFVFGRGGEEAHTLRAAGIEFEVVPGVTSGLAAPAYAGIPVTHRDHASAVALITGHEDPTKPHTAIDWPALAAFPGTLVFYMGVRQLEHIATSLIAAGRPPDEPVAVVERGTLPGQRSVAARLDTVADVARAAAIAAPAITVVGPVAALAGELAWQAARPLAGRTVAVTRARAQSSALAARLGALGARVLQTPAIRTQSLDVTIPDLSGYDLLCLTSPAAVRFLFEALAQEHRDARSLAGLSVAAMGPGTARELRDHGVIADIVPERFVAEGLVEALVDLRVTRALIARPREARDVLSEALRTRGAEVDVLALYETLAEPPDPGDLTAARAADYVTFTSSSTVRFFCSAAGGSAGLSEHSRVVSIGPATSETLREHGIAPHVQAADHDIDGLVDALVADAAAHGD